MIIVVWVVDFFLPAFHPFKFSVQPLHSSGLFIRYVKIAYSFITLISGFKRLENACLGEILK